MKQTSKNTEHRLPGITALVVLLLQGAMAQEEITLPKKVFGTGPVNRAAYSPDGKLIATANAAGTYLWDATTGAQIRRFPGPMEAVPALAFSPDGTRLATGSTQGRGLDEPSRSYVRVWDVETGTQIVEVTESPAEDIRQIRFSQDGQTMLTLVWGNGEYVNLRDAATGQLRHKCSGDYGLYDAAFSPDGGKMVTACGDRMVRIWDVTTGQELRTLRGHTGKVTSAAFSPDGATILSGSRDGTARLWDAATGTLLQTLWHDYGGEWPEGTVQALFSPDGAKVLTAVRYTTSQVGIVRLWDAGNAELPEWEWEFRSGPGYVPWKVYVGMSHDTTKALVAVTFTGEGDSERDWTVGLVDLVNGGTVSEIAVERPPSWVVLSPDGASMLAMEHFIPGSGGSWLEDTVLRNVGSGEVISELGFQRPPRAVALSADGTKLAAACQGGTIIIWDVDSGREERRFDWPSHPYPHSVNFWPDGSRLLVTGSWLLDDPSNPAGHYGASVWDPATGEYLYHLGGPYDHVAAAEFSPDGQQVVLGGIRQVLDPSDRAILTLLNAESGATIRSFTVAVPQPGNCPATVDFSDDGKRIVACLFDLDIRIWDVATGALIRTLGSQERMQPKAACFSPDGRRVLAAGISLQDVGGAILWNAETGEQLMTFLHDWQCHVARFSPDGKWVLTFSAYDRRIWDAETGAHLYTMYGRHLMSEPHQGDTFSPDGKKLFGIANNAVVMWELISAPELTIARETDGRVVLTWQNLSDATAYTLQQCPDLASAQWTDVTVTTPGRYEIAEPVGAAFYRLKQP